MNRKIISVVLAAMLTAASLCGCTLAKEDGTAENIKDQLIGVYITTEHLDLFDHEAFLEDNINTIMQGNQPEADAKYSQRLYALQRTVSAEGPETDEFYFEGIDGISFFSPAVYSENGFENYIALLAGDELSDIHCAHGEDSSLEGTIYMANGTDKTFYMNPVYQTAEGSVYLTAGTGLDASGSGSSSMTLSETYEKQENGETNSESFHVIVNFEKRNDTEYVTLREADENNTFTASHKITADSIPDSISFSPGTAYVIIEEHGTDVSGNTTVTRELINAGEDGFYCFFNRGDGIMPAHYIALTW